MLGVGSDLLRNSSQQFLCLLKDDFKAFGVN